MRSRYHPRCQVFQTVNAYYYTLKQKQRVKRFKTNVVTRQRGIPCSRHAPPHRPPVPGPALRESE